MLKTLKMDFYKFIRTKSFYIILGAVILSCSFIIWSFYITSSTAVSEMGTAIGENIEEMMPSTVDEYFDSFFQGNFLVLFTVIFTVLFCSAEYKHGYIKNTASMIARRSGLVFSKLVCIFTAVIIMQLFTVLCVIVGCVGIIGVNTVDNMRGIILEVVWSILLNMSLASVIMMLFMTTRKATMPMIVGIIYVLLGSTLFSLINLIFDKLLGISDFDVAQYTNIGNLLYYINSSASKEVLIRSGIVAAVFFVLSCAISCVLINKKDIR